MNNEEKILTMLEALTQGQTDLKNELEALAQGQADLKNDVAHINQEQARINVIIETEIRRNIKIIAEGHGALNKKLDDLKGLNEKVIELQTDTSVNKNAIRELYSLNRRQA